MSAKRHYIHQIYYDEASRANLAPEFIPLDNTRNERPDWREYWPIRTFLKENQLDSDALYGFFSPKFQLKSGLTAKKVVDFIDANDADVYIFSPFVEQTSVFLNVFEQGDTYHPGLLDAMQQFTAALGVPIDLRFIVSDFNTSPFSNYFVAKPAFWMKWLALGEKLFAMSEATETPFAQAVNALTEYHDPVAMKVFMMERLAALLLAFGEFSAKAYDPFALNREKAIHLTDQQMRIASALKMAFLSTGDREYISVFSQYRGAVLSSLSASSPSN